MKTGSSTSYRSTLSPLSVKLYSFIGRSGASMTRWNLVFAGTFLVSLPILIFFLVLQRMFVRGAVSGAVKG